MTQPRLTAADARYKLGAELRKQLNSFMETADCGDYTFGPFGCVSDAVYDLLKLQRRGTKSPASMSEAAALEEALKQFCKERDRSFDGLMQVPALVELRQQRDRSTMTRPNSCVTSWSSAHDTWRMLQRQSPSCWDPHSHPADQHAHTTR